MNAESQILKMLARHMLDTELYRKSNGFTNMNVHNMGDISVGIRIRRNPISLRSV